MVLIIICKFCLALFLLIFVEAPLSIDSVATLPPDLLALIPPMFHATIPSRSSLPWCHRPASLVDGCASLFPLEWLVSSQPLLETWHQSSAVLLTSKMESLVSSKKVVSCLCKLSISFLFAKVSKTWTWSNTKSCTMWKMTCSFTKYIYVVDWNTSECSIHCALLF